MELKLQNHLPVFWMTGLSGSGKTSIAESLAHRVREMGIGVQILDGDALRSGINSDLGFSMEDRKENVRRTAEIARLMSDAGIFVIVSLISPTKEMRNMARKIIGIEKFREIFIDAPIEICEMRDVKGLYKKARKNASNDFTGIGSPYEKPSDPDLLIDTAGQTLEESLDWIYNYFCSFTIRQ
jgi:adenylylsulfate kinase